MKTWSGQRRRFFRHPIHVPIKLRLTDQTPLHAPDTNNLGLGGLSFYWPSHLLKGCRLNMEIPVGEKRFDLNGRVVYSKEIKGRSDFRIGVKFTDFPSSFKARLAEEILRILDFQHKMSREAGRDVSAEEAAEKWVSNYARKFPD